MSDPAQRDLPDGFRQLSPWLAADWPKLAVRPRDALRAAFSGALAVRFGGVEGPPTVTSWTFDRDRHGEAVCIAFHSPDQLLRFSTRWRELAAAIHESGREDASFGFRDAKIDLGDGVWPDCPSDVCAFARRPGSTIRLIPNIYLLRPRPRLPSPITWEQKTDTLYFRGTSTGSVVYEENARVILCRVAQGIPRSDCRISRMKQIDAVFAKQLGEEGLVGQPQPAWRLNDHRFLVDADGNVSSWDRYLLIGSFGGVPIRFETSWEECWHDELRDGEHCVCADRHTLKAVVERLRSDPEAARRVAENAKALVESRLSLAALRLRLRQTLSDHSQQDT